MIYVFEVDTTNEREHESLGLFVIGVITILVLCF